MVIKDTLYAKYIKEREDLEILETEKAFITYRCKDEECFIANMFIEETDRNSQVLPEIIATLNKIARDNACKVITGAIRISDQGRDRTLAAAFKVGFKTFRAENDSILILKEVA